MRFAEGILLQFQSRTTLVPAERMSGVVGHEAFCPLDSRQETENPGVVVKVTFGARTTWNIGSAVPMIKGRFERNEVLPSPMADSADRIPGVDVFVVPVKLRAPWVLSGRHWVPHGPCQVPPVAVAMSQPAWTIEAASCRISERTVALPVDQSDDYGVVGVAFRMMESIVQ
ncbi:MAG TPA: hypothetical protein VGV64_04370 [Thermoplasmata archaeon]|nr:hypothetical protein [Thermoplasmata archaeon]